VILFTGYGVITEKPRVGQFGLIVPCTCRKNYALNRNNVATIFDGLDELYYQAKFGEDPTTRTGCRCENVVFVFCFFSHAQSLEHCAFEGCIVRTSIALPFVGRFRRDRRDFQRFFQKGLLFQTTFSSLRWRHNFREVALKIGE